MLISSQQGLEGKNLKKHMDTASYIYTKAGFDKGMAAMRSDCEEAYNWLAAIPSRCWARHAFDYNFKQILLSTILVKYLTE